MKPYILIYIMCSLTMLFMSSCIKDEELRYESFEVPVQLRNPVTGEGMSGVSVLMSTTLGNAWQTITDEGGWAHFILPAGVYDLSASGFYDDGQGNEYVMNCSSSNIEVTARSMIVSQGMAFTMVASRRGSLVIKELYQGGCQKDDGSGAYYYDKYVILYNNGQLPITIHQLGLGMAPPYNSQASNANFNADGQLNYASEGFIPAIQAIWYFNDSLHLEGGEEIVIALNGAVDHTVSYSQSVNLGKPEYYCTYDPLTFTNTSYYPVPSEQIPTDHYLTAALYGQGNAWPLSQVSPAFYIFNVPDDIDIAAYANDADNIWYHNNVVSAAGACLRIPTEWILDGVEVYTTTSTKNAKRLTDEVDAGAVYLTNTFGYSLHRNVDVAATKAIVGNEALLVYGVPATPDASQGVVGADPSGINAEASVRQGAFIIYQDTNNSTNDFFERYQASLRD